MFCIIWFSKPMGAYRPGQMAVHLSALPAYDRNWPGCDQCQHDQRASCALLYHIMSFCLDVSPSFCSHGNTSPKGIKCLLQKVRAGKTKQFTMNEDTGKSGKL